MVWGTEPSPEPSRGSQAQGQPGLSHLLSCGACPSHRWSFSLVRIVCFAVENSDCRDEQKKAKDVISPPRGDCSDHLGRCLLVDTCGRMGGCALDPSSPGVSVANGTWGPASLLSSQIRGLRGTKQLPGGLALGSHVCHCTAMPKHVCAYLCGLTPEVVALLASQAPVAVCECSRGQWCPSAPLPLELVCAPSQPLPSTCL